MYPLAENLLWRVMSSELVAALGGAITGGIIALFGGIAQVFIQGWISNRGRITYALGASELSFTLSYGGDQFGSLGKGTWEEARAYYLSYLSLSPVERQEQERQYPTCGVSSTRI